MIRSIRYLAAPLALGAVLATTAAGCGSDGGNSGSAPQGGVTLAGGGTGAPVSCTQIPYDVVLDEKDPKGSGIVVSRGYVRGAVWAACQGVAAGFTLTVQLLKNGLDYGSDHTYIDTPDADGYPADVFAACTAGVYRLQYSFQWSANGRTARNTTTAPISETVTQHDCDS